MKIIMIDYPIKHSPTPQGRHSSQAQFQSPENQILSTNKSGDLAKRILSENYLPRPPQKISGNLFSLVSKFEALDALGVPIKISALKPAPLRLSQHSPRDKLKSGPSQVERRSGFFCQIFRNRSQSKDLFSNEELVSSVRNSPFTFDDMHLKHDNRFEQFSFGRMPQFQKQYKPKNIRGLEVSPDKAHLFTSKKFRNDSGSQPRKSTASKSRRTTILDRIRFFDGSTNNKFSASLSPVVSTKDRPSLEAYPTTPLSRRTSTYKYLPLNTSPTRPPMSQAKKINIIDPLTPTRPTLDSDSTKQRLALQESSSNPLFAQISLSKSSMQANSPRTLFASPKVNACPQAVNTPSLRGRITFHGAASPLKEKTEPKERDTSQNSKRSRIPILKRTNPMCTERRKVSGKVEDLYRNKSRERKHEDHLDVSQEPGVVCNSSTKQIRGRLEPPKEISISTINRKLQERESKVSNRHTLFDGAKAAKEFFLQEFSSPSGALGAKTVALGKGETFLGPTPPPVPLPTRLYEVSTKTVLSPLSKNKKGRARSKVVEDRMKRFEEIPGPKEPQQTRLKICSIPTATATISTIATRRKEFEDSRRRFETTGRVGMGISAETIDDILGELRDADEGPQRWKRRTTTNGKVLAPSPIKPSVKRKATAVDGAFGDVNGVMTVRTANCGLKEPKPLRYSEMEKILWLCRGKVGGTLDLYEEKRSASPSKQKP